MSSTNAFVSPEIGAYLTSHTTAPTVIEQRLIDETAQHRHGAMQINQTQGQLMAQLVQTLNPTTVVEIGTFTGYSALKMAGSLRDGSTLIACDVSDEWTSIGRPFWAEAGVADRIDLRIGPASETLAALDDDLQVDVAFIDADKTSYLHYLELLIPHLHERSLVLVDNVLWSGRVLDDSTDDAESTAAMRTFNDAVVNDSRLSVSMMPVGDGLSFITLAP